MKFNLKDKRIYLIIGIAIVLILTIAIFNRSTPTQDYPEYFFTPSTSPTQMKTYTNGKFGFSISYPDSLEIREFTRTKGLAFRPMGKPDDSLYEVITINILEKNADLADDPLSDYAKVAATLQIRGYQRLNTINEIKTDSGVIGYQTTWFVSPNASPGWSEGLSPVVSEPITYFDAPKSSLPSTIQFILNDKSYLTDYQFMVRSFKVLE